MCEYQIQGQNQKVYQKYQTLNYCDLLIQDYSQAEVDEYHLGFGRLFQWLTQAI